MHLIKTGLLLTCLLTAFSATSALAEKPSWNDDGGRHGKSENHKQQKHNDKHEYKHDDPAPDRRDEAYGHYFDDRSRVYVHDYYAEQYRKGRCPPGLAKKHNGCMPPGQAKKWKIGRPLPRDVVYYALPPAVIVDLGRPPSGRRYVRVANDILLIAVGSRMVIDAIDDLNRR